MLSKLLSILLLIPLFILQAAAEVPNDKTKVVEHQAPGNLEVTHAVDCVDFEKLKPEYSPADLYPAVRKCIVSDQYEKSVQIFILAGAYSRFDKKRVADESAHQATTVLLMHALDGVSDEKKASFQETFQRHFVEGGDGSIKKEDCERLRKLGSPNYQPDYMIKHGLGVFLPDKASSPLVKDFKAESAWNEVLEGNYGCPSK